MALRETGRIEDALASSNDAIASDQSFAEAHANRGDILQDLQRPHEALDAYERALALMPDLVAALINRGSLLQELGRHEDALESYDRAVALVPNAGGSMVEPKQGLAGSGPMGGRAGQLRSGDRGAAGLPSCAARAGRPAGRPANNSTVPWRALTVRWRSTRRGREAQLERASILHKAGDPVAALAIASARLRRIPTGSRRGNCTGDCCTTPHGSTRP